MVKLIAKRSQTYATRRLTAGDVFEASNRDARILTAIGRAARYVEPDAPVEPVEQQAPVEKPKRQRKDK